jgi:U4/U6.U5 tri-snRNP-associated protein 1
LFYPNLVAFFRKELALEMQTAMTEKGHETEQEQRLKKTENNSLREITLGNGLGVTLDHLRERGVFQGSGIEWAGRNNDKKLLPHQTLVKEALFSGDDESHAWRIEAALRHTDEFGRVLTAKEAFRKLCYHFHGKGPSKNRQKKRVEQYLTEVASKKKLTSAQVGLRALDR